MRCVVFLITSSTLSSLLLYLVFPEYASTHLSLSPHFVRFPLQLSVSVLSDLIRKSLAILYYDYALTVMSEIQYFWSPPSFSPSFILFVISRYFGLLGPIPVFFEYFGIFPEHVSIHTLTDGHSILIN